MLRPARSRSAGGRAEAGGSGVGWRCEAQIDPALLARHALYPDGSWRPPVPLTRAQRETLQAITGRPSDFWRRLENVHDRLWELGPQRASATLKAWSANAAADTKADTKADTNPEATGFAQPAAASATATTEVSMGGGVYTAQVSAEDTVQRAPNARRGQPHTRTPFDALFLSFHLFVLFVCTVCVHFMCFAAHCWEDGSVFHSALRR